MSVVVLSQLPSLLQPGARLLGLDLGEKTIGIALSDTLRSIASPMGTLKRGKFTADSSAIQNLISEHNIGALIIGMPFNMDGSVGPAAQSARAFANNFAKLNSIPIVLVDERLSTAAVTRTLLEADASRKRRCEVVDKMAAAYILQGALDRLRMMANA